MTLEAALTFVSKMREDLSFRLEAMHAAENHDISELLNRHDISFEREDLIRAMAACMDEMSSSGQDAAQPIAGQQS